jgi:hypothetical protein
MRFVGRVAEDDIASHHNMGSTRPATYFVNVVDTRLSDDGRAGATHTFFATAGPALRTVSVRVVFTLIGQAFASAGAVRAIRRPRPAPR